MEIDLSKPVEPVEVPEPLENNPYLDFDHIIEQRKAAGVTLDYLSRLSKEVSEYDPYVRPMEPADFLKIEKDYNRGIDPHTITYARLMGTDIAVITDRDMNIPPVEIKGQPISTSPKDIRRLNLNDIDPAKWVIRRIDVYVEDKRQYDRKLEGSRMLFSKSTAKRNKGRKMLKTIIPYKRYVNFPKVSDDFSPLINFLMGLEKKRAFESNEKRFKEAHLLAMFKIHSAKNRARKALIAKRKLFVPTWGNT